MTKPRLAYSHSALKMFEQCPYRFYHQRVLKSVQDQGGEASQLGHRIHESIEHYIKSDTPLSSEAAHYSSMVDSVKNWGSNATLTPEVELTINQNLQPTGWWDEDAWFRCKVDVLALDHNRRMAFEVDWKTGKRRPDMAQLEYGALLTFIHYPEVDTVLGAFIWFKDRAMDKQFYTRDNYEIHLGHLLKKIQRVEDAMDADTWPAKPSGLCNWCPCKDFCEYKS